jgi:hypothetical protein
MRDIVKVILSACVDRTEYKSKKDDYHFSNTELGIVILNLIYRKSFQLNSNTFKIVLLYLLTMTKKA